MKTKPKSFGRSALLAVSLAVATVAIALPSTSHAGRHDGHNYDVAPAPSPLAQIASWLFGSK